MIALFALCLLLLEGMYGWLLVSLRIAGFEWGLWDLTVSGSWASGGSNSKGRYRSFQPDMWAWPSGLVLEESNHV